MAYCLSCYYELLMIMNIMIIMKSTSLNFYSEHRYYELLYDE